MSQPHSICGLVVGVKIVLHAVTKETEEFPEMYTFLLLAILQRHW
jgi:hypothetical protein